MCKQFLLAEWIGLILFDEDLIPRKKICRLIGVKTGHCNNFCLLSGIDAKKSSLRSFFFFFYFHTGRPGHTVTSKCFIPDLYHLLGMWTDLHFFVIWHEPSEDAVDRIILTHKLLTTSAADDIFLFIYLFIIQRKWLDKQMLCLTKDSNEIPSHIFSEKVTCLL